MEREALNRFDRFIEIAQRRYFMEAGSDSLDTYAYFFLFCHRFKLSLKKKSPVFAGLSLSFCYRYSTTHHSLKSRPEPKVEVIKIKLCAVDHTFLLQSA